jgi:hypothetical protein
MVCESTHARVHTRIGRPPSHGGTERLGFDARRDAPATRPAAVVHESDKDSCDSCTAACGRVLGLLRRPTRRTRSAFTPRVPRVLLRVTASTVFLSFVVGSRDRDGSVTVSPLARKTSILSLLCRDSYCFLRVSVTPWLIPPCLAGRVRLSPRPVTRRPCGRRRASRARSDPRKTRVRVRGPAPRAIASVPPMR